ncbi:MAG: endonuclease/exonuclease/phosphatase family protein [Leptospiraceae bacterium]|nr:endonuclease/exonuclease/phosphatase family protein [Leptospiraceae bacterium]
MKVLKIAGFAAAALVGALILTIQVITYHPDPIEEMKVHCPDDAPELSSDQPIKVLDWNIQYLAGKNYVFWYDTSDGTGKDVRPSSADIQTTLKRVQSVIRAENPDIVMLQEVNVDAASTDHMDQIAAIMRGLPQQYKCHTSAYYWKADFVPDPHVMGSVGMKLLIISKYKISSAQRHQLAMVPMDPVSSQFYLKRAVLTARMPVQNATDLVVLNTHLDAFAQGSDTMQRQVAEVRDLLSSLSEEGVEWIIGGDFNLLPPNWNRDQLAPIDRVYYQEDSEIANLFDAFQSSVSEETLNGPEQSRYYTHFPNSYTVKGPDRTIDYIFYSEGLKQLDYYVRGKDTLDISDHLPLVGTYQYSD